MATGLDPDTNKLLPFMLYSDGSQSNSSWRGFKFHPVMICLPEHCAQQGRKRYSVRRIGWLPSLEAADLPFEDKFFKSEE